MIQVALVGCGHIHTPKFLRKLKERKDINVKYVWDHEVERARKNAEEIGAQTVTDVDKIWSETEIEAAIICSETNLHEALVVAGAEANKHLFVEKPLGIGSEDAYNMADAIQKAGVLFQTGFFMRGNPIHLFLRDQIQKGNFGKITRFRRTNFHNGSLSGKFDTDWRWMAVSPQKRVVKRDQGAEGIITFSKDLATMS